MQLTYLGTNTLVIQKGASTVLIDPHFSRPGLMHLMRKITPNRLRIQTSLEFAQIMKLDGVLLTHTHYDHALDAVEVVQQAGGVLYGSNSAAHLAKDAGLSAERHQTKIPGDYFEVGAFRVGFHPTSHITFPPPLGWLLPEKGKIHEKFSSPTWFWQYHCGEIFAIQVDNLLVFGSAGFRAGAYQEVEIKTVVLGIGGLETQPDVYLEKLYWESVVSTGAEKVYLSHWDNFFIPVGQGLKPMGLAERTIRRFTQLGKYYGQSVSVLSYAEPLLL